MKKEKYIVNTIKNKMVASYDEPHIINKALKYQGILDYRYRNSAILIR